MEGTRWCDPSTGFTKVSADKQQLTLYAINREGKILYTLPIKSKPQPLFIATILYRHYSQPLSLLMMVVSVSVLCNHVLDYQK
ncbi:hypothetical protein HMPREF1870_00044 [Bacteroidales bacterium KA00344]|nr:hypothetical protein HMPREF1870_00044 [Bacteroidales bacterium KA00344]